MTYTDIIKRAKRKCRQPEEEETGVWTDAEWLSVLNDIQLDFVEETEAIMTEDRDIKTVKDKRYVSLPSGMIRPTIVYLDGRLLVYKNPKALAYIDPDWVELTSGAPDYFYFSDGKIYFERDCDAIYDMVIFGIKEATDMSTSQTTPFNGYSYLKFCQKYLIKGLVADFFDEIGDYDLATKYLQEYEILKAKAKIRIHQGVEEGDVHFSHKRRTYVSEV